MAFPFPADKVLIPAAKGAEDSPPRKSKSRRIRRVARDEERLLQSYTVVEMDDLEEQGDSQSIKKPKKK